MVRRRPLSRCECDAMFGTVITSEAHWAYTCAYKQNNNTAELFGVVKRFSVSCHWDLLHMKHAYSSVSIRNMLLIYALVPFDQEAMYP